VRALQPPLPEQQIHADLHAENVLVRGEEVAALLDFEFTAVDWRVMDLVVGLSKYVGVDGGEAVVEEWLGGYAEGGGELTADEARLVPDFIILRILSNVVYFVGRALAREDMRRTIKRPILKSVGRRELRVAERAADLS
jgi:Ser/Thr protein kinase RdoA (MazF antagonist)